MPNPIIPSVPLTMQTRFSRRDRVDPGTAIGSGQSSPRRVAQTQGKAPLNILSVVLGDQLIYPAFASLYREELVTGEPVERLYVCERCFKYTKEAFSHVAHRRFCKFKDGIPGRLVYEEQSYELFEVDGEQEPLFAQNLNLFSKLFIEQKSACFDVPNFLYYVLVPKRQYKRKVLTNGVHTPSSTSQQPFKQPPPPPPPLIKTLSSSSPAPASAKKIRLYSSAASSPAPLSPAGGIPDPFRQFTKSNGIINGDSTTGMEQCRPQIVGYFSKEKNSWNDDNLACILVFPLWQKLGLGQLLMSLSYELARREGRFGGPEHPLSVGGTASYKVFWRARLARALLSMDVKGKAKTSNGRKTKERRITLEELCEATYMLPRDVVNTITDWRGEFMDAGIVDSRDVEDEQWDVLLHKNRLREWCLEHRVHVDRGHDELMGLTGQLLDYSSDEEDDDEVEDEGDDGDESEEDDVNEESDEDMDGVSED